MTNSKKCNFSEFLLGEWKGEGILTGGISSRSTSTPSTIRFPGRPGGPRRPVPPRRPGGPGGPSSP